MNQATANNVLPADFRETHQIETAPAIPVIDTVGHVLRGYAPLALMLCNQINFEAGREMMRTLNHNAKHNSGKTEQDIHPDKTIEDEFATCMPEDKKPMDLAKAVGLVGASIVLSSRLEVDDTSAWMKKEPWIRAPKSIISDQLNWIADKQAETRQIQATRFGLALESATIRKQMEGEINERVNHLLMEAKTAVDFKRIIAMETEELLEYIEEAYDFVPNWDQLLKDRITGLFERNVKKLQSGGYADMDDTLIALAQSFAKK